MQKISDFLTNRVLKKLVRSYMLQRGSRVSCNQPKALKVNMQHKPIWERTQRIPDDEKVSESQLHERGASRENRP